MSTILVVEQDISVRPLMKQVLQPLNQEIQWAMTAEEAKIILDGYVCGLVVSGLRFATRETGLDLYKFCLKQYPNLPFILLPEVPGDLFDELLSIGVHCPPFLPKASSVDEYRTAIIDVLNQRTAALRAA